MAFRISFFKTPEHRVYSYKPRYYDETREHIKELEEKYHPKESETGRYIPGIGIREAYRRGIDGERRQAGNTRIKGYILLVTLILLFVAAYYLAQLMEPLFR